MDLNALHSELMNQVDTFTAAKSGLFAKVNEKYMKSYNLKRGSSWGVYYKWISALVRKMKFKNILELGTGTGTSSICILSEMTDDAYLTTIDIRKESGAFFTDEALNNPRFSIIKGNSTTIKNIRPGVDFLFIDSLHVYKQARLEFDMFEPQCINGAFIVMDDIHSHDMDRLWDEISYLKLDISKDCHGPAGFGVVYVER